MNLSEAKQWAELIATVDHGCDVCVRHLLEKVRKAFPEFWWGQAGNDTWYGNNITLDRVVVYQRNPATGGPILGEVE